MLYLDQESPDNERDLLTFRELFLHSYALENIIVGGYKAFCTRHSVKAVFTMGLLHMFVCVIVLQMPDCASRLICNALILKSV